MQEWKWCATEEPRMNKEEAEREEITIAGVTTP
jgi:hypothetical protein